MPSTLPPKMPKKGNSPKADYDTKPTKRLQSGNNTRWWSVDNKGLVSSPLVPSNPAGMTAKRRAESSKNERGSYQYNPAPPAPAAYDHSNTGMHVRGLEDSSSAASPNHHGVVPAPNAGPTTAANMRRL